MKDINLLPDDILYKNKKAFETTMKVVVYSLSALIVLALLLFLPLANLFKLAELGNLKGQLNSRQYSAITKELDIQSKLAAQKNELLEKKKSIAKTDIKLLTYISEAEKSMVNGSYLKQINYNSQKMALELGISAKNSYDIEVITKKMHDSNYFKNITSGQFTNLSGSVETTLYIILNTSVK